MSDYCRSPEFQLARFIYVVRVKYPSRVWRYHRVISSTEPAGHPHPCVEVPQSHFIDKVWWTFPSDP